MRWEDICYKGAIYDILRIQKAWPMIRIQKAEFQKGMRRRSKREAMVRGNRIMPGRERNGRQIQEGGCGDSVSNASERLRRTLMEKSPLLTPKRTLPRYRIRTRLHVQQKDKT